jgi:hypothetical protein
MRTVFCIAAIAAVSFVPVSASAQQAPPTSSPRPATAPTTPAPPTVKPTTAPTPNLPATTSRKPPTAAVPSINFEPQSGPTPAQGAPRPGGTPQGQQAERGQLAPAAAQPTSWQNVRLEIKISDTLNSGSPETAKVVSMLILDGRSGQVRSTSDSGVINVDARPTIRPDGRIYLQLGFEYRPELTTQQAQQTGTSRIAMYNETLNLVVVDGKSILASQSADPRSDRKVVIEITATVIK